MFASLSSPSLRTTLRTVHERTAPGPQDRSLLDAGCVDDEVEEHRAVVISHANQHNSPAGRAQSFRQAHRVRDAAAVLAGGPVDFRIAILVVADADDADAVRSRRERLEDQLHRLQDVVEIRVAHLASLRDQVGGRLRGGHHLPFQAQQVGALDDADEERQQDRQHERELHRRVAALVAQDLPGRCHRQPPGAGGNESTLYGSFWKATVETRRRPASPLGITVSIKGVENFQRYMDRTTVTAPLLMCCRSMSLPVTLKAPAAFASFIRKPMT